MLRILITIALTACIKQSPPTKLAFPPCDGPLLVLGDGEMKCMPKPKEPAPQPPAPRNFVCERFAAVNEKAVCTAELSDVGEFHAHTARVAIDQMLLSCFTNDRTPSVVCTDLIVVQPTQQRSEEPKKPPAKKK